MNAELSDSPERPNQDPYGKGWLARINPADFKKDAEKLLSAKQYADYIKAVEE